MDIKIDPYLKNKKCLYVEDDLNIYFSFYPILQKIFKEVLLAKNGKEGLEVFKKKSPDLILSDIKMPEMSGLDMACRIKKINPHIPILLITAFTDTEYLTKAMDIQIDGYITKPLNKKKLFQKLNEIAEKLKQRS